MVHACISTSVAFVVARAWDADMDGICDDIDDCVGAYDACGVCNGDDSSCGLC